MTLKICNIKYECNDYTANYNVSKTNYDKC